MVTKKKTEQVYEDRGAPPRGYELVAVISPEIADEQLETRVNEISNFITERGGVMSDVEQWGKRKLAYAIGGFTEGNYVLYRFEANPAICKEVESNLQIAEDILRFLLIRAEG